MKNIADKQKDDKERLDRLNILLKLFDLGMVWYEAQKSEYRYQMNRSNGLVTEYRTASFTEIEFLEDYVDRRINHTATISFEIP